MQDYGRLIDRLVRLIAAHDKHVNVERETISADKAWAMLALVEETFRIGMEMMVEVTDEDVAVLEAALSKTAPVVAGEAPDPVLQMRMRQEACAATCEARGGRCSPWPADASATSLTPERFREPGRR
jgi:hypothetical protein